MTEIEKRHNFTFILIIALILSIIGLIVQIEWGMVIFEIRDVEAELGTYLQILGIGLLFLAIAYGLSVLLPYSAVVAYIMPAAIMIFMIISRVNEYYINGVHFVYLGQLYLRFSFLIPIAFVYALAILLYKLPGVVEWKLNWVAFMTLVFIVAATILDELGEIYYILPVLAYFTVLPFMRRQRWYLLMPLFVVLLYIVRVIWLYLHGNPDELNVFDSTILGWLNWDKDDVTIYFLRSSREMALRGGMFGKPAEVFLQGELSYRDLPYLTLNGVCLRYGLVGFLLIVVLYGELCRRILICGANANNNGNYYEGLLCRGVGLYFAIQGIMSVISTWALLPLNVSFEMPFLCMNTRHPWWFFCLAAVLISSRKEMSQARLKGETRNLEKTGCS